MSFLNEKTRQFEMDMTFLRNVMLQVYIWMALGLLTTAGVAFATIESGLVNNITGGMVLLAVIVELGLVIGLRSMVWRMSPAMAIGTFFVYAGSMGSPFRCCSWPTPLAQL